MTSDADTPDRMDTLQDLAEHVVGTSGSYGRPRETLQAIFGEIERLEEVARALAEKDVTLWAEDSFQEEKTRHQLHFAGRTEYTPCVADALEAAVLLDRERVIVRSFDPVTDEPVTFEFTGNDVTVTPTEAVISFGMAAKLPEREHLPGLTTTALAGEELPGGRDPDAFPNLACTYINAFEQPEHYTRWRNEVDAVTVALPPYPLMQAIERFTWGLASA